MKKYYFYDRKTNQYLKKHSQDIVEQPELDEDALFTVDEVEFFEEQIVELGYEKHLFQGGDFIILKHFDSGFDAVVSVNEWGSLIYDFVETYDDSEVKHLPQVVRDSLDNGEYKKVYIGDVE